MHKSHTIAIDARRLRETTGRYARELLNQLQKIDSENTYHVIIHKKDEGKWQPTAKNFNLHVVPWDNYTFGEQIGFLNYLRNLNVDLVHFTMPQQPLFYRRPKVTTVHDLTLVKFNNDAQNPIKYKVKQAIFKVLLKNVIKNSKVVFTLAKYTQDEIMAYGNVARSKVIIAQPAADAMSKSENTYEPAVGKDYIIYVGNTFPYKNIGRLIEAHQKLIKTRPNLHLFIVGKVDDNVKMHKATIAENSYKQVHFTGFVDDSQLAWLYKNARAYVFPSLSEGFGMPPLEAMQFDLPVVCSDATVLPEVYGDSVHYFNPEDVDEMAKSIDEVLSNEQLRKDLIENSHEVMKLYSWEKMARTIHSSYLDSIE